MKLCQLELSESTVVMSMLAVKRSVVPTESTVVMLMSAVTRSVV